MRHYIFLSLFLFMTGTLSAQQGIGLHFMNNVVQSNFTNPGKFNEYKINVSLPSVQLGYYNSAFSLSDIYEVEGNTMFLDFGSSIDQMDDFNNLLQGSGQVEPFAVSFRFGKLQVGAHYRAQAQANVTYPKGLFQFLWYGNEGVENEALQFGPDIQLLTFQEIGLNLAYQINDQLSVGTRLRALSGMLALQTERSTIELLTDQDRYTLTARTDYLIKASGFHLDPFEIANEEELLSFGGNSGFGIDLGATYKLSDRLTLQASVLDLGSIQWDQDVQEASSIGSLEIEAYDLAAIINDDDEETKLVDTLKQIFNFEINEQAGGFKTRLGAKTYVSATYEPISNLFLGALMYGEQTDAGFIPTFALSANKAFGNIFSVGATYSARRNSFSNIGLNMALRLGGFQIFGTADNVMDMTRGNYYNLRFGFNLAFGKNKSPKTVPVVPVE